MHLEYSDFYDIAEYANEHWKACMTPKETACNASDLLDEYRESVATHSMTPTMVELVRQLWQDIYESDESLEDHEATIWIQSIIYNVSGY